MMTREDWTRERLEEKRAEVKAATLAKGKHHTGNGFGLNLAQAVRFWPTPTTQDASNNGPPSQMRRNTKPLNAEVGGALNPTWVEWLMGFPLGWTDCGDSATRSSRKSRKSSAARS
jgi:hypothetical protein